MYDGLERVAGIWRGRDASREAICRCAGGEAAGIAGFICPGQCGIKIVGGLCGELPVVRRDLLGAALAAFDGGSMRRLRALGPPGQCIRTAGANRGTRPFGPHTYI